MALWDIVTLVILGLGLLYGIWKGFLKLVLKVGAFFLAIIVAKPLGNLISSSFIDGLFNGNKLEEILQFIVSIVISIVLFIILYILFRIIARVIASALNKLFDSKKIDKVIGAIIGLVIGGGIVFLLATVLEFAQAIVSSLGIYVEWLDFSETFLFRFFL